jgi:AcrR family transcriptional regulator
MTNQNTSAGGSRRERPAKAALSRQGIVAAALDILRAEGLAKVTMRRISAALDTGPASLYVYVRDTEDLHAQLLDALLEPVVKARLSGAWQARLKLLLKRYLDVLFGYPEMARMAMSTMPNGPNYLALCERLLGLLGEGGIADRDAAWAIDLLLLVVTASAAEHGTWNETPRAARDFATMEQAISSADPRLYPNIARIGDELLSGGPARLDWGLDVLIAGVLATPRPTRD